MSSLQSAVLAIQHDGLVWGHSTLIDIGFGIKKLQQNLVIEDKVSLEDLEEEIKELQEGEWVQSTDGCGGDAEVVVWEEVFHAQHARAYMFLCY